MLDGEKTLWSQTNAYFLTYRWLCDPCKHFTSPCLNALICKMGPRHLQCPAQSQNVGC